MIKTQNVGTLHGHNNPNNYNHTNFLIRLHVCANKANTCTNTAFDYCTINIIYTRERFGCQWLHKCPPAGSYQTRKKRQESHIWNAGAVSEVVLLKSSKNNPLQRTYDELVVRQLCSKTHVWIVGCGHIRSNICPCN